MTAKVVGLIGAGHMGLPIIGHLVRAGYSTLVCDIDSSKREAVAAKGAQWIGSVAELAPRADFVLICVGYDEDVKQLFEGMATLGTIKSGTIIAVISTVRPRTIQHYARQFESSGVHIVDSTITRGWPAAEAGTLLSLVGGSKETVAQLTPVIRAYSSDIVHCGAVGSAMVAKAVSNMVTWACLVADHEGLALANAYGVDIEVMRNAMLMTNATNGPLTPGFWGKRSMPWAVDDMAIVMEMMKDNNIELPQARVVKDMVSVLKPIVFHPEKYGK